MNRLNSPAHFAALEAYAAENPHDIIAVTETFLGHNIPDTQLALRGYNFFRHDRVGKAGGGVGIYVKVKYRVKILVMSNIPFDNSSEFMIAEVTHEHIKVLFAVVAVV